MFEIGSVFGRLTVLELSGRNDCRQAVWRCLCECGKTTIVTKGQLTSGNTRSCGCLGREARSRNTFRHGHARMKSHTSEYKAWCNLIQRCTNPRNPLWKYYGARGIKVCVRWRRFDGFILDMGRKPHPSLTLERVNNARGYVPGNCKWATRSEQNRNRREWR